MRAGPSGRPDAMRPGPPRKLRATAVRERLGPRTRVAGPSPPRARPTRQCPRAADPVHAGQPGPQKKTGDAQRRRLFFVRHPMEADSRAAKAYSFLAFFARVFAA